MIDTGSKVGQIDPFSDVFSTTYSSPSKCEPSRTGPTRVRLLTINLFLRPAFVTNSDTNDLKFERLR